VFTTLEKLAYLIESVEQIGNQRTTLTGVAKSFLETKLVKIADEWICSLVAESERITPEVPLECDDGSGSHADPDHGQGGLSAGETRVEESQTRYHDQHHRRSDDDVGLVTRLEPLVQILGIYEKKSQSLLLCERHCEFFAGGWAIGIVVSRG